MAYQGSAAYQLDDLSTWEAPARRPLSVHRGDGLDARALQDSSRSFATLVRSVVVLTVVLALLGVVRVALTARTVSLLKDLSAAEATVERARDTRTELMVERSALTSTDRIQRIATENYGMVYASEVDAITIEAPQAEDAQSVQGVDATSVSA